MRTPRLWHRFALGLGGLLLFEAGARIAAPNLNGQALSESLRNGGGTWLLSLYDRLGGGGLSRGGVLALGIMPYLSARIMIRLARVVSPAIGDMPATAEGRTSLTRWTRVLTVGLSLVQSYGFARFVQSAPGAVAHPGIGFIAQTMLVLTTGSIVAMALSEQISRPNDEDDEDDEVLEPPAGEPLVAAGESAPLGVHGRAAEVARVP